MPPTIRRGNALLTPNRSAAPRIGKSPARMTATVIAIGQTPAPAPCQTNCVEQIGGAGIACVDVIVQGVFSVQQA